MSPRLKLASLDAHILLACLLPISWRGQIGILGATSLMRMPIYNASNYAAKACVLQSLSSVFLVDSVGKSTFSNAMMDDALHVAMKDASRLSGSGKGRTNWYERYSGNFSFRCECNSL